MFEPLKALPGRTEPIPDAHKTVSHPKLTDSEVKLISPYSNFLAGDCLRGLWPILSNDFVYPGCSADCECSCGRYFYSAPHLSLHRYLYSYSWGYMVCFTQTCNRRNQSVQLQVTWSQCFCWGVEGSDAISHSDPWFTFQTCLNTGWQQPEAKQRVHPPSLIWILINSGDEQNSLSDLSESDPN